MASSRDHLRNIQNSTWNIEDSTRNIESSAASTARSAAENTRVLKGIAFTSSASMVFNGITAANTARQAKTQKEQFALQQEQHALQQAIAEQTARHEFSMWRQTPEGTAYVEWQQRAAALIPFLRGRERTWNAAWENAIGRAQAAIPMDERRRLTGYPARLKQTGLKIAAIASLAITGLFILGLGFHFLTSSISGAISQPAPDDGAFTYEECLERLDDPDNFLFNESDCEAINPNATESSSHITGPLVLFAGLTIAFAVLRKVKQRQAQADPTVRKEAEARVATWGFDPLTTHGPWYPWHESQGFTGYADRIGHMVHTGASQRPAPSQLIPLKVPTPWTPDNQLPGEVNNVLISFQEENKSLSG